MSEVWLFVIVWPEVEESTVLIEVVVVIGYVVEASEVIDVTGVTEVTGVELAVGHMPRVETSWPFVMRTQYI